MALTPIQQAELIAVAAFGATLEGTEHKTYFENAAAEGGKYTIGETGKQIHEVLGLKEPLTGAAAVAAVLEHEYNDLVSKKGLEKVSDPEFVKNVAKNLGADTASLLADLEAGTPRYEALAKFTTELSETDDFVMPTVEQDLNKAAEKLTPVDPVDPGVKPDTPTKPTDPVNTIELTDGRDNKTGTADNDLFDATAGQNQNGTIANAFATGDELDGAGGYNTLEATVVQDFRADSGAPIDIRANTKNIQEVHFEAVGGSDVTVQATRMANVEQYWSNFSDENLTVSDISLQGANLNVTKDVTFGLKDVRAGAGLNAYFDSNSLVNAGTDTSNSQLVIRIADVSTETPATPLANVNMNLSFVLGGKSHELTDLRSTDGSYAGLVAAANAKLAEIGLGRVEASLTDAYNSVTFAGNTVNLPFTANVVMLTDPEGAEFGDVNFTQNAIAPVTGGFLVAGNAEPFDPNIATTLIESNLVLDNAGRGSLAGDVVIGGMSNSGKVVEKLNLSVDRDSKIDGLHTGFNAVSGAITPRAFKAIEVTSTGAKGKLEIGEFGGLDGKTFVGAVGASGIQDAKMFNASNFEGTSLKVAGTATSNDAYSYTTAGSEDIVHVNVEAKNSASSKFSLSINTEAGNDIVTVEEVATVDEFGIPQTHTATMWANHSKLQNITIDTGAGDDVINANGYGAAVINAGTGNDLIFTDNTGNKAKWVVNGDYGVGVGVGASTSVVGNGDVAYNMIKTKVQVDFLGLKSKYVLINSNADHQTTARAINEAIKLAIANDETLSKLLKVTDARNDAIEIETTFGRLLSANDLSISFLAPKSTGTANPAAAELLADWDKRESVSDSELKEAWEKWSNSKLAGNSTVNDLAGTAQGATTEAQVLTYIENMQAALNTGANAYKQNNKTLGTNDTADTQNVVNAGSGHDVIVLSSNTGSGFDTVKFEAGFGHNVLVNFNTDTVAAGTTSRDVLDFTSFLDATANARGTSSGTPGAAVGANKVTERSVQYDFNDFSSFGVGQSTTDAQNTFGYHNTVNKINLSDIWANLSTTAASRPTSFEAITEAQLKAAIEAILTTTGRDVALDGMKFTVMLVQDQEINRDTNGDPVLGGAITDPSNALILSGTTSVTSAGDQTFTFTKQGSIEFVGAFSSLNDIGAKHIAKTAAAIAAEKVIADKIAPTEAPSEEPTEEPTDPELPADSVAAVVDADGIANVNFAGTDEADVFTVTLDEATAADLDLGQITITDFGANDQLVLNKVYDGGFGAQVNLGSGAYLDNPVIAESNSEGHLELALMKAIDVENADIDVWTITFENADQTIIEKALAGDFADWLLF